MGYEDPYRGLSLAALIDEAVASGDPAICHAARMRMRRELPEIREEVRAWIEELEARNPQWSDPEWNAAAADTLEHVSRTIPRVFHEIEVVADED